MEKDYILKEIIRTTKENTGVPLGRLRFKNETGIKISDWYGKYWAKWGDAIREAGYEPNKK
ncbi:MAG: GIY-YIG nuclease family protein, partial [Desulfobaccales bacterium]